MSTYIQTFYQLADSGNELDAAAVTKHYAINLQFLLFFFAVSVADEGKEAKGRGKDDNTRLGHC